VTAENVEPGVEPASRWASTRGFLRRRWILVVTLMTVAVSGATIGLISGAGVAASCGGFSGSSGGQQCQADLSIDQVVSVTPARVGQRLFYLAVVTNKGPATARYVRVVIRLPLNASGQWALSSFGECAPLDKTHVADCIVAYQLQPGHKAAVTVVVVPHSTVTLISRAGVSSSSPDDNQSNNVVTTRTKVRAA
jgi:uncharacterized repeat protein (TIGR01451 family)